MENAQLNTFFDQTVSDDVFVANPLTLEYANRIFTFFQNHWLFMWDNANNDCEDRANAITLLLEAWNIPNYKGWVFSGFFLKNEQGTLTNLWNYHVAPLIPVSINNVIEFYSIDPATQSQAQPVSWWANNVTDLPFSYYVIKQSMYYIFPAEMIQTDNWHIRNDENYTWTIEGLAGLNGASPEGEAMIQSNQRLIEKTKREFNRLKNGGSPFR
ncbi:protein-glutamine glutaminase family protein [Parasediminibacterium sp. JCM 36343]|uniref:protein-glutamine glutaminase family protein n=1 Tax=Parasediminibacterium sp. JCM 36343 TaxID=3374279 RepID=UPI00397E8882